MRCPFCNESNSFVKDSRDTDDHKVVRRRRQCSKCNGRFTTFERIQIRQLVVVKRSGDKKRFDGGKIVTSIKTAMRKRHLSEKEIERIANDIILEIESSASHEISTRKIGKLIMQKMSKIDPVAYIRFASVYKDFSTIQDFAKFIGKINK